MEPERLPITNEYGCYEIRLESIGGLGANLCGKMLGELGMRQLGLNSASFSSYGSEKTGSPVKAFIRYSAMEREIRVHSAVKKPHILGIFHDALLKNPDTLEGCMETTAIVINTELSADNRPPLVNRVGNGQVFCIPAQRIAMETHARINSVMLGALAKVMGFVPLAAVEVVCTETLGRKYPDALPKNLEGIRRGYAEVRMERITQEKQIAENPAAKKKENVKKRWGYDTAPIGGINTQYGNSVIADLSPSRQGFFPVYLPERCIHCGLCDTTCPDMVFQFSPGVYKGQRKMINRGLDYYHCKGCLRCVEVCPVQALIAGLETEYPKKRHFLPNQELTHKPVYYEKAGADGYVTSESFLTEKRIEGGEV